MGTKIAVLKQMDNGVSGLSFSGKVGFVSDQPKKHEGTNQNGAWMFHTQFITVEDETGDIGVDLQLGKEPVGALTREDKGRMIDCTEASVNKYTGKDGVEKINMRAKGVVQRPTVHAAGESSPGVPVSNGKAGKEWVIDRDKDFFILTETITEHAATITATLIARERFNADGTPLEPAKVPALYSAIHTVVRACALETLSVVAKKWSAMLQPEVRPAIPAASPAPSTTAGTGTAVPPADDTQGWKPEEVPF